VLTEAIKATAPQIMFGSLLLSIFTLLSGVVALLVSYYALRFNRVVGLPLLRFIAVGFGLVGFSLLVESGAALYLGKSVVEIFGIGGPLRYEGIYLLFNIGAQVAAYFVFAMGYAVVAYGRSIKINAPTAASLVLVFAAPAAQLMVVNYYIFLFSEVTIVLLLAFIVFQGLLIYLKGHNIASLLVLIGFVLIFAAHILILDSGFNLSAQVYLVASGIQLTGFVSLLIFLIKSGRIGPT
jgi:hypothetical protein